FGFDEPGGDDVDVDAVRALFLIKGLGERFHGGLAHVVRRAVARVPGGGDAGDHDDVAAFLFAHAGEHELGQVVGAEGVGADDALHFGGVGVVHVLTAAGDAGIVDEDADASGFGDH